VKAMIRYPSFALGVAVAIVLASPAQAQTDAQKQEAKEHYEKGRKLYDVGRYGDAIEEYQKVYLLTDDPNMLFNIGQCYRLSDHPEEAVRFYRSYLRRAPSAPNRADVETKILALDKIVEEHKRTGASTTPPASTGPTAEPPPMGTAPPPPPPPAPEASVAPPPVTAQPPSVAVAPEPAPPPSRAGRVTGYVLLGTGGALVLASIVSGSVAAKKAKDLGDLSKNGGVYDPKLESSGKAANGAAIATGVIGVLAAGIGGYLLYSTRPLPAAASLPRPTRARVALYPLAGPQVAGAGARVTF